MATIEKSEIVILGCGLAGMMVALSLVGRGAGITVVENRSTGGVDFFYDPRSTALTASSREFLSRIGVWDHLAEIVSPIKDIYVADNKQEDMIHFSSDSESMPQEYMGYMVLNTEFKKQLFDVVRDADIKIIDECSYSKIRNNDSRCSVELANGQTLNADLVIVCDGRNSIAKKHFFSDGLVKEYGQKAITFLVRHEKSHEGTAVEHFMHSGPFAILPLKDEHMSSVVWSVDEKRSDVLMKLPREEFAYLVQENFGEFLGKISIESEVAAFPLTASNARKYVNKRMLLVADAAHIVHPLAGQGLNQGIKDIEALIALITKFGINSVSLGEYEKARISDNQNMLDITDTINSIFSNNSLVLGKMRNIGFKYIEKMPPFKKALVKYAMGRRG